MLKVIYNSVIGHSKDGSVGVLVDGDDRFRTLHSRDMLEGTADANGDVNLRLYGLP